MLHSLFAGLLFCSGYQVMGDLAMLSKTWPFAEDILTQPKRVVDLKVFAKMVSREDRWRSNVGGYK